MKKIWIAVFLVLLVLGGSLVYQAAEETADVQSQQAVQEKPVRAEAADVGARVGQQAPTVALQDMSGKHVQLEPGDGRVYVLNFWATWCPPCRSEMPELDAFAKELPENVVFYAISLDGSLGEVQNFVQGQGYTLPVLFDSAQEAATQYKIREIPTTFVIDGEGIIQMRKSGITNRGELEPVLAELGR